MKRGQLKGKAIIDFALAGNATFTIQNPITGNRFTYRIRQCVNEDGKMTPHFVSVLTGNNNNRDYRYIGFIRSGHFIWGRAKARVAVDAPSVKAFIWFWKHVGNPSPAEVLHEGRCGRCGRTLTVPESIERGIGPECAKLNGMAPPKKAAPKESPKPNNQPTLKGSTIGDAIFQTWRVAQGAELDGKSETEIVAEYGNYRRALVEGRAQPVALEKEQGQ